MAYPTATEIVALRRDLVSDKFTEAALTSKVTEFAEKLERYRGVAYITRTVTGEAHLIGRGARLVPLDHPIGARDFTTITIDGVAHDGDGIMLPGTRCLRLDRPAPAAGIVTVSYTHGLAETPPTVYRACVLFVWRESMAEANPNTANTYLTTNSELGIVERASTADPENGRLTGWIDVDGMVNGLEDLRGLT